MDFLTYIIDNALVLIPVLLIIGAVIKHTPVLPDWCIPWVLMACGIGFAVLMLGVTVDAVIQGVLTAGAAVFGNQLWKQTAERDDG